MQQYNTITSQIIDNFNSGNFSIINEVLDCFTNERNKINKITNTFNSHCNGSLYNIESHCEVIGDKIKTKFTLHLKENGIYPYKWTVSIQFIFSQVQENMFILTNIIEKDLKNTYNYFFQNDDARLTLSLSKYVSVTVPTNSKLIVY